MSETKRTVTIDAEVALRSMARADEAVIYLEDKLRRHEGEIGRAWLREHIATARADAAAIRAALVQGGE